MTQDIQDIIEDEAGRFPEHMLLIRDLFAFSFADASNLSLSFSSNSELFDLMSKVETYIRNSDLPPDEAEQIISMMEEEIRVIAFSQSARRSVIAL